MMKIGLFGSAVSKLRIRVEQTDRKNINIYIIQVYVSRLIRS